MCKQRCNKLPCSHSDRLFGGFLRTYQRVILLTPFKNLSLVGVSFPPYCIFLHTLVVTSEEAAMSQTDCLLSKLFGYGLLTCILWR